MSSTRKLWSLAGLTLGTSMVLGAPSALISGETEADGVNFSAEACPPDETKDAHAKHAKSFTTSRSNVVIKQDHGDGQVFELKMNDGECVVLRNGKKIHEKHIKKFPGGKVMILGDDGDELTTFELEGLGKAPKSGNIQKLWIGDGNKHGNVVISGDADFAVAVSPDNNMFFGGDGGRRGFTFNESQPPVMLGIHLGEPGPALRYHLGLKDLDAILVEGVTDGLPADEAGLQKYDVIVSIDGSGEANGDVLHKVMSKKDAGDELRLVVVRGCDKIRVTAELDAYDAGKLNAGAFQFGNAPDMDENVFKFRTAPNVAQGRPFVWSDNQGQVLELLHNRLRGHMTDEQLEKTHRALRDALEGVEFDFEFGGPDVEGVGVMEFKWDGKDHKLVIPKGGEWRHLVEKELPHLRQRIEHKAHDAERKSEELHERLSERLERLSEEIERLRESLDDLD